MSKNTMILVVATVVIVVIAGAVAYVMLSGNDKDFSKVEIGEIGTYVPIYGNATSDLYIDDDDVDMLQSIIDGKSEWDINKAPFADANQDGKITSEDVDIVKNIIDRKPCLVRYQDYYGNVTKVNFPLVNMKIAVTYYQQAEACAILGVLEDIKVACAAATAYGTMWPSLKDAVAWGTPANSNIDDDAVEKIISNDVKLVVCTPRTENQAIGERLFEERGINFIQLWYNGDYCISTIQTMGILMDKEDKSRAYMDYCNGIANELSSKLKDKERLNVVVFNKYDASTDKMTVMSNDKHGAYVLINKYLANAYTEEGPNQFGLTYHNVEWLIENNNKFDGMIYSLQGNSGYVDNPNTGTYFTQADFNSYFEDVISSFTKTTAYKNGYILGTANHNIFGFSAYPLLKVLAAQLYPDLFSFEDAMESLQEWFDKYNVVDIDVTKTGPVSYTGTNFKTAYPQLKL